MSSHTDPTCWLLSQRMLCFMTIMLLVLLILSSCRAPSATHSSSAAYNFVYSLMIHDYEDAVRLSNKTLHADIERWMSDNPPKRCPWIIGELSVTAYEDETSTKSDVESYRVDYDCQMSNGDWFSIWMTNVHVVRQSDGNWYVVSWGRICEAARSKGAICTE